MLTDTKIVDLSSFYELITGRIPPTTFSESFFLYHLKINLPIYDRIKLVIDFLFGIILWYYIYNFIPFYFFSYQNIFLLVQSFFLKKRVGKNNKIFYSL